MPSLANISWERLEREQKLKAQTDLLTGALNRHAFVAYGDRLVLRHEMTGKPLCLLVFDLDQFKALNDRFGHAGGDAILLQFVAVARGNIRPGDLLFRLGGDEFCCLLPYTNVAQACEIAERVRVSVAASTRSSRLTFTMPQMPHMAGLLCFPRTPPCGAPRSRA